MWQQQIAQVFFKLDKQAIKRAECLNLKLVQLMHNGELPAICGRFVCELRLAFMLDALS